MRVVLVSNGLTHAGAETQMMRLARTLRRRGDDVGLLSILPNEAFLDDLATLAIPAVECKLWPRLRAVSAMSDGIRVLRAWRPDAVVSFLFQADMLARVAGRLTGVPVIISSIRNERVPGLGRERLIRLTDRLCTLTTTNSELAAEGLVHRGVVPRERLVVVPNGVDPSAFTPPSPARRAQIREALGVGGDQFLWLAAGRLEAQKDYPTLLRALAAIAGAGGDPVLRIAGQGPLRTEIEALAARLGVASRAQLLGLRTDVADLLAAADAVVLSSAFEGLPNIVLEAMAAGRPVVASRVGGVGELVVEGVTGTTVSPGQPEELGRAMSEMMALPEETRRSMGSTARSLVASRFSVDAVTAQWAALLDREVARRPRPPRARPPMSAAAR
ncbi:MAG TPA: glycosyltransferase [Acidimicrobiales bacterium]|jgi:glycosyltransferase involved in cell wall biosynthesis|nr:glycosyltransferase [Acidimicrobiales bacterium]